MLNTTERTLNFQQQQRFKSFGIKTKKLGADFAVFDTCGKVLLHCQNDNSAVNNEKLSEFSQKALKFYSGAEQNKAENSICCFESEDSVLAVVLRSVKEVAEFVALIDFSGCGAENSFKGQAFTQMLQILAEGFHESLKTESQFDSFSFELAGVYEELVLLHRLSTNMRVNKPEENYLQMACDNLTDIVLVEGIVIFLEEMKEGERKLAVVAGSGLIDMDEHAAAVLYDRLIQEVNEGKEALLDSEVDSSFKYDWPDIINSIIAVPLCRNEKSKYDLAPLSTVENNIMGVMVAINRIKKPDFDTPDVKLFNSVANSCAVFIENRRLFGDLKELFIGSLKALTSSIDAKDEYTRGHSQRVAFISKWIAERLEADSWNLTSDQVNEIYLAGLLHDIGKLGIDETVLRKDGKLTKEEYDQIKRHPAIGAGILAGIKQMRDIVGGVLYHHERMDGKGYPHSLADKQIPLMGKIIAIADSFDAMTSRRAYRDAMSIENAIIEIKECSGTQFDEKIAKVFLKSDLHQLWEIIKDQSNEGYESNNLLEYGAIAVGALLR